MAELNDHSSRAHAVFSASASERWLNCPASAMIAARYPAQDTPFTREGTLAHEVAECIASGRPAPEPDEEKGITPEMVRHAESYRDYISGLCTEDTDVMLEQRIDFSSCVWQGFGTADCILLTGDHLDVIDYKYGQGVAVSAEKNPQMMLYAIGAIELFDLVTEIKTVSMHIFQPRLDAVSTYETTPEELEVFASKCREAVKNGRSKRPKMSAGTHCKFCPHAGHCPELAISCIKAVTFGDDLLPEDRSTLAPDAVAELLKLEPMISAWLKKVKDQALADLLLGKDIPGYKAVEGKLGNRAWSNELAVMQALDAAGIAREDYTTTTLLSPAAMDKALGKKRAAELLEGLVSRAPGSPTIAPVSDKRKAIDRDSIVADMFEN